MPTITKIPPPVVDQADQEIVIIDHEDTDLTVADVRRLDWCERTIQTGMRTFLEVGNALIEIRDHRLYRAHFSSFEDYCRVKWTISKSHANRLIQAAEVVSQLPDDLPAPTTERQARALAAIPDPDERARVWADVSSAGTPTGAAITAKAARPPVEMTPTGVNPGPPARTLVDIRYQHAALFGRLSRHGWDAVGKPRQKGMTTFVTFRHGGTHEENEMAEGELPYWLEQLDQSKALRDVKKRVPSPAPAELRELQRRYTAQGWTLVGDRPPFTLTNGDAYVGRITIDTLDDAVGMVANWESEERRKTTQATPKTPTPQPSLADELLALPDQPAGWGWEIDRSQPRRRYRLTQHQGGDACTNWHDDARDALDEAVEISPVPEPATITLPPFPVADRAAFEAEVRDLLENTVIPNEYPLVTGLLRAVARYAAMQEATV